MGLFKFKKKEKVSKKDKKLLAMYEKGQVLRIDEDVDNKQLILEKE